MNRRRSAFTLIELLVVISILLILSTLVFAVFNTGRSSDKTRSAARIAQSAFLGAKDRALHAKDLRGIRFTRDNNGPAFANGTLAVANGFVFLQPLPTLTYVQGSIQLERIANPPSVDPATGQDVVIVHGGNVDWDTKVAFFPPNPKIRIPSSTGQWYQFTWNATPGYSLAAGNEYLQLATPFAQAGVAFPEVVAFAVTSGFSSCDIQLGNDLLPFHQPITLPSGVIIDLASSSTSVQNLASNSANLDIMFSPRGNVSGVVAGQGTLHFLIRGLKDATALVNPWAIGAPASANPDLSTADRLILSVFPQTGLVQVFEIDPTDSFTNPSVVTPISYPGSGSPDGIADNLFNFAMQGKSAGR